MRFILFISGTESFNYFSGKLTEELTKRHHEIFTLDLRDASAPGPHSLTALMNFMQAGTVQAAIGYDQMATISQDFCDLWNEYHIPVISIYMDPLYRFGAINRFRTDRSIRYCCDLNHVSFCRRYHHDTMPNVFFMPHAASLPDISIPWDQKKMNLLFSGTWYNPENYIQEIKNSGFEESTQDFLLTVIDFLKSYPHCSVDQAVERLLSEYYSSSDEMVCCDMLERCAPVDWYIRMYFRAKIIETIISSGQEIYLLGRGWENLPATSGKNVHILSDRVSFAESLRIMAQARINLNVMPWFKDGTHDRVFNTLLRDSAPLTDDSIWLREHLKENQDCFYYDLQNLEMLPSIIKDILDNPVKTSEVIRNGKKIVADNYIWKNLVDQLEADITQF